MESVAMCSGLCGEKVEQVENLMTVTQLDVIERLVAAVAYLTEQNAALTARVAALEAKVL